MPRHLVQFSCGAASAVAAKLILAEVDRDDVLIVNAYLKEEHADNRRFLADCIRWFNHPVTVLQDEKYGASTDEVWRRKQYMVGPMGAPCSANLKREILDKVKLPDDIIVLGYTAEESGRLDNFIDANNFKVRAPLIEKGLSKADCLAMVERAGIKLPEPYLLGFNNSNCIGCPKGGMGYWNRIRTHFPDRFETVATIQDKIGPGAFFFRDRETKVRFGLRGLDPEAGRHEPDIEISCSFFCEMAEQDIGERK